MKPNSSSDEERCCHHVQPASFSLYRLRTSFRTYFCGSPSSSIPWGVCRKMSVLISAWWYTIVKSIDFVYMQCNFANLLRHFFHRITFVRCFRWGVYLHQRASLIDGTVKVVVKIIVVRCHMRLIAVCCGGSCHCGDDEFTLSSRCEGLAIPLERRLPSLLGSMKLESNRISLVLLEYLLTVAVVSFVCGSFLWTSCLSSLGTGDVSSLGRRDICSLRDGGDGVSLWELVAGTNGSAACNHPFGSDQVLRHMDLKSLG